MTMGRTYRWARRPDRTACGDPEAAGARPLVGAGAPPGGGSGCPPQDPHARPRRVLRGVSSRVVRRVAGAIARSPRRRAPRREHPQMADDFCGIHAAVVREALRGTGRAQRQGLAYAQGAGVETVGRPVRRRRRRSQRLSDGPHLLEDVRGPATTDTAGRRASSWHPRDSAEVTGPGTTMTARPSASATSAVRIAPDRAAASTTRVPALRAATRRLRTRKRCRAGVAPGGYSVSTRPVRAMWSISVLWVGGYDRSMPHARTATVRPPTARAPRCAAPSTPSAAPETTVTPWSASSADQSRATHRPYSPAAPGPDHATQRRGASSRRRGPHAQRARGTASPSRTGAPSSPTVPSGPAATPRPASAAAGHSGSSGTISRPPRAASSARSAAARSVPRRAAVSAATAGAARGVRAWCPRGTSCAASTGPIASTRAPRAGAGGSATRERYARARRTSSGTGETTAAFVAVVVLMRRPPRPARRRGRSRSP